MNFFVTSEDFLIISFFYSCFLERLIATEYYSRSLRVKKGNLYFVNTANNKNNILIHLTLAMDRSLPVESTPQIDFENTRDEDVAETSRKGDVDYSKRR